MKKYLLCFFCIGLLCSRCKKENQSYNDALMGKWQFYSNSITRFGADACQYQSKPEDLYLLPASPYCEKDNVWEFSNDKLTIYNGSVKCMLDEPEKLEHTYRKTDNDLTIDGRAYHIVSLSNDTLIIDNCQQINLNGPGMPPVGPSHVRVASKYSRMR
mgnify:FL=1